VPIVLRDYREAGRRAGWKITSDPSTSRVEMSNAKWTIEVEPAEEDGLVTLVVHPRRS
jgi:hypothetical protein